VVGIELGLKRCEFLLELITVGSDSFDLVFCATQLVTRSERWSVAQVVNEKRSRAKK